MPIVRCLVASFVLLLAAGCSVNTEFVYKPGAPMSSAWKLPVKVAVLPFQDGTEDFTSRGSVFDMDALKYNLAKAGWGGVMTALTPDLWAKAFADEMAATGRFQGVRFLYSSSELVDEDLRIEGTLEKATLAGAFVGKPNEFALGLRAFRRTDAHPVWEKKVSRKWINEKETLYDGCGEWEIQCAVDRHHADANRMMQGMFAEAGADLVATLAPLSGRGSGADDLAPASSPAPSPPGSTDGEIERILKGN